MSARNEELLLRQLAGDVAKLMDERDELERRLAYWVSRCVEQEAQLLEAAKHVRELTLAIGEAGEGVREVCRAVGGLTACQTLGEPGDALAGQEASA